MRRAHPARRPGRIFRRGCSGVSAPTSEQWIAEARHGRTEFPLSVGVVGTVLAPVAAAIGALVALLTYCTIEVERTEGPDG